ncbi:MAG: hypothetical protein CMI23_10720 [Opitutae bacterium]|nr:hypothetical protein [Opitutae bacterium]|tara:strand:- start:853 stop:1719 length:867 start_codon:yes stop_codon:yes gene_type:complete
MTGIEKIFYCIIFVVSLLFFFLNSKQKRTKLPKLRITNSRGESLDKLLQEKKGQTLSSNQKAILTNNLGIYYWLPEEITQPWEERILSFLASFPITYMKKNIATEEMKTIVAAEACLLIVNRNLSDYRHLKVIHLWEDEIKDNKNVRGSASRNEINLSWKFLKESVTNARDGHNLILHEFAHLIDFADDGIAQSIPVSRFSGKFKKWERLVDEEHKKLMNAYNSGKNYSIRAYGGYESINGNKPEIFSCGTSAFFERGARLKRESPEIYKAFKEFYKLDPATWKKRIV